MKKPNPLYRETVTAAKDVPCADCGGRFPRCAMEFDHVRGTKVRVVSRMQWRSQRILLEEIAKCEVVCANCHAIRTEARRVQRGEAPAQDSAAEVLEAG